LTWVNGGGKMTPIMVKTQVYLRQEELDALREVAAQSGRSMAELIREAIRATWLPVSNQGPGALWQGDMGRTSSEHDSIYDDP
jgi:hypothetical protein